MDYIRPLAGLGEWGRLEFNCGSTGEKWVYGRCQQLAGDTKSGREQGCEIAGFVRANDPDDAFSKTCTLAKVLAPEILQAAGPFPRPVTNAEEIQEVPDTEGLDIDKVEVYWTEK